MLTLTLEKQIMNAVGEILVNSEIRKDPVQRVIKEKEGVFDMAAEQAQIDAMVA